MKGNKKPKYKENELPDFPKEEFEKKRSEEEISAYRMLALAEHEDVSGGVGTYTPSAAQVVAAREWSEENKL